MVTVRISLVLKWSYAGRSLDAMWALVAMVINRDACFKHVICWS